MAKTPFINAISASVYIVAVSLLMFNANKLFGPKDTILTPIAVLSLFTLSAAVMGYLFLYQPLMLFLESKKKQAVDLFLQTVMVFAIITALIFILLISRVLQ